MAKYSLRNGRTLNCAVLDENYITNTYKVKFSNGLVRNVKKSRVHSLNRLDEGVIDRLKSFGKKLLDKVISVGKYVYLAIGGKKISTLFNVMINAEEKRGLSFYPGKTFTRVCDTAGVEPTASIDDSGDDDDAEMVNAYWTKIMDKYSEASDEAIEAANESYGKSSYAYRQRLRLFESDEIKLAQGENGFQNVSTKEVQSMLIDQYREFLFDGAGKPGATTPIPYLIWGAPGIGKTQIIKGLISLFREGGIDANLLAVNARTMRRDDFALPGMQENDVNVKTKDGKAVTIKDRRATETTKEWLPMYNPDDATGDITVEMLDDIANGGNGTGNGKGGFIFVDELSRVPGEVMDVFMGLVQDRQYGRRYLGSKWMFVFAANRLSDMGERGEDVHWESAYTNRFSNVNFVPTFREWLVWAQGKNSEGKQRIEPVIIDFLKEHQSLWYDSKSGNDNMDDEVVDSMYPNPRGWENISKEMRAKLKAMDAVTDKNDPGHDFMAKMYKSLGLKGEKRDLSPQEISNIIRHHAGNKAAATFKSWDGFDARFSQAAAAKAWTMGANAPIPFQVTSMTINKAIQKVLASNPAFGKKDTINVTPDELMNVAEYIIALCDKGDDGTGNTRSNLIAAAWRTFVDGLSRAPYNINLFDSRSATYKKYINIIQYIDDELGKTDAAVAAAFGEDDDE